MAQRGVNKVIVLGNLGKDPEVRHMPNGDAVANITVATSEVWMDKNTGEKKEKTEWHRVVFFRKLAEIVDQYLKKGSKVYIEGKLVTRKWQADDGSDRYSTEIVVDQRGVLQMLSKQEGGQQNASNTQRQAAQTQQAPLVDDGFMEYAIVQKSDYGTKNSKKRTNPQAPESTRRGRADQKTRDRQKLLTTMARRACRCQSQVVISCNGKETAET